MNKEEIKLSIYQGFHNVIHWDKLPHADDVDCAVERLCALTKTVYDQLFNKD